MTNSSYSLLTILPKNYWKKSKLVDSNSIRDKFMTFQSCEWVRDFANNAVGLPKQRNSYQSNPTILCFESPTALFASQCNLFRNMWPDPTKGPFQCLSRFPTRPSGVHIVDHLRSWIICGALQSFLSIFLSLMNAIPKFHSLHFETLWCLFP